MKRTFEAKVTVTIADEDSDVTRDDLADFLKRVTFLDLDEDRDGDVTVECVEIDWDTLKEVR